MPVGVMESLMRASRKNISRAKKSPCILYSSLAVLLYATSITAAHADQPDNMTISMKNFGNVTCAGGIGNVLLTGYYTNNNTSYMVIFLKVLLHDAQGHVLAVGSGHISDVKPHQTKAFNAIARFTGNFTSCNIVVDSAIPR